MFSQASVILSTIGLMATLSLLILVTVRSVRILLECFLGEFTVKKVFVPGRHAISAVLSGKYLDYLLWQRY